ncbi:antibiotic biosynthesis monooxygenase family protein [Thermodesulfobacteriota bacterium]
MPVRVLIIRKFKEGYVDEINKVIKQIRYAAIDQDGYITSETMWDHEDPFRVVIASSWRSLEHWKKWYNSDLRKTLELKLQDFTHGEAEYELFNLGVSPPLEKAEK